MFVAGSWPGRLARLEAASGRRVKVERGTNGHDAARIDVTVAPVVVPLDVGQIDGRGNSGPLMELPRVRPDVRIIDQAAQVALEVAIVDGVETDERGE